VFDFVNGIRSIAAPVVRPVTGSPLARFSTVTLELLGMLLGVAHLVVTADADVLGPVCVMSYSSDLTDEQWALLELVFNAPGKRGPRQALDLRRVVDAMLYISHTGCQWRFLPESFGPWTRVWS
jgi:hypothetical protein